MFCSRAALFGLLSGVTMLAQAKLTIDLALHQFEDGPALPNGYEFLPGETVWFSCRIAGYQAREEEGGKHVRLSWQMRVTDADGVAVERPSSGRIDDRLHPEDKEWRPKFLSNFLIPAFAFGGTLKIPVEVKDEVAGTEVFRTLELPVKGPPPFTADSLTIRNFRFLRNENDAAALQPAVYRPGTMLWARFDIAGYKLAENNRFDVGYGLAILGAEDKQLFAQPDAAQETKDSFYPQRWVPGALSLSLDANVASGTYTLVVIVRDKLSGATAELREPFQVQ
jgi:hypothetical protein